MCDSDPDAGGGADVEVADEQIELTCEVTPAVALTEAAGSEQMPDVQAGADALLINPGTVDNDSSQCEVVTPDRIGNDYSEIVAHHDSMGGQPRQTDNFEWQIDAATSRAETYFRDEESRIRDPAVDITCAVDSECDAQLEQARIDGGADTELVNAPADQGDGNNALRTSEEHHSSDCEEIASSNEEWTTDLSVQANELPAGTHGFTDDPNADTATVNRIDSIDMQLIAEREVDGPTCSASATRQEKGEWGEQAMDQVMQQLGYEVIGRSATHTGIEGVYSREADDEDFGLRTEYVVADAKCGEHAKLGTNAADGVQLSDD